MNAYIANQIQITEIYIYLLVRCLGSQLAQPHRNVFVRTRTDAAKAHSTLAVVLPERTLFVQIDLVEPEVVFHQQAA